MEEAPKRHIACGICRRRKLKCDGRKPTCSTCQRLNQVCEYSDVVRKAGPKRGYVRSLETRISQLEKLLNYYRISEEPLSSPSGSGDTPTSNVLATEEPMPPKELVVELTEAFFLRCNIIHACIDRKRYMTAMSYPPAHQPPPFLQYAVMASAAAITPKYRAVKPLLYERARKYIEKAEVALADGTPSIQYIVALGLLGHYDARENRLRVAWLSIGKAWRAIIMLSLNMLDAQTWDRKTMDSIAVAEARRAVWFIYFCDRAGTLGVSLPPIINPDDVFVKLPMDDEAFLMGAPSDGECFKTEELLKNPNLFTQYPNARTALTICLVEVNYQVFEMGRFPKKNRGLTAQEWFAEFNYFDNVQQKLLNVVPLVPPIPAAGGEDNKVVIEEKSRRTAYLQIYLWAQAGVLFTARSGLHGIQQYPLILTMANPGKLLQRALMSMLEVLLVTRNPHDLEAIGTHPLHPILLFALAVIILTLAEHNLVSLDNFKAPVEYVMSTLQELVPIMPLTQTLSEFLAKMAPQLFATCDANNVVNRVEDVLQRQPIDLSLPNFMESSTGSTESSPQSIISPSEHAPSSRRRANEPTPSPHNSEHSYTFTPKPAPTEPSPVGNTTAQTPSQSSQIGFSSAHTVPLHPTPGQEVPNMMPVYEDALKDSVLDLEPPIYIPEIDIKNEFAPYENAYDQGLGWTS